MVFPNAKQALQIVYWGRDRMSFLKRYTAVAALGLSLYASIPSTGLAKSTAYGDRTPENIEKIRKFYSDQGGDHFLKCEFSRKCEDEVCTDVSLGAELMGVRVQDTGMTRGDWYGPAGSSQVTVVALSSVLSGIAGAYGDRVSLLSMDMETGRTLLSLHGTTEHWTRQYSGQCWELK
jgi:hypothetical protein